MSFVNYDQDGAVAVITINREKALNALNSQVLDDLDTTLNNVDTDVVRCLIITGAGPKSFVAGADIGEMSALTKEEAEFFGRKGNAVFRKIETFPIPVIAAVNGFALGGGLEVALACHLIVADPGASFGLPEVKVGLVAAAGGLVRLPRVLPPALARDMILTGRRLTAEEALAHGLISRISPPGRVLDLARTVAAEVLAASPTAVSTSISAMTEAEAVPDTVTAVCESLAVLDRILVSSDTAEGILAFLQKRPPRWTGR